jgi:hypothetical protein
VGTHPAGVAGTGVGVEHFSCPVRRRCCISHPPSRPVTNSLPLVRSVLDRTPYASTRRVVVWWSSLMSPSTRDRRSRWPTCCATWRRTPRPRRRRPGSPPRAERRRRTAAVTVDGPGSAVPGPRRRGCPRRVRCVDSALDTRALPRYRAVTSDLRPSAGTVWAGAAGCLAQGSPKGKPDARHLSGLTRVEGPGHTSADTGICGTS